MVKTLLPFLWCLMITSCAVGPDYVKPSVMIPQTFKEDMPGWKTAHPQDDIERGPWWEIFKDPCLNQLEEKIEISNHNIAAALSRYQEAKALVDQSRSAFFPLITGGGSITRQRTPLSSPSSTSSSSTTTSAPRTSGATALKNPSNTYLASLDATWEPDLWGKVRRDVESSEAGLQASAADVAVTKLSFQALLAQNYFQLRTLDEIQKLLDEYVLAYKNLLKITQNRYQEGIGSRLDILQAQSQLEAAQVDALDNQISRGQLEHAIAVLVGLPPSHFSLSPESISMMPPEIPLFIPAQLLERRPDIAQAERLAAQANAQIGVAMAAYFPTITLSGDGGYRSTDFSQWIVNPARFWTLGLQLAQTIFDGGAISSKVGVAQATYEQNVASYRQTVLAAFQDVEDNLIALRILREEEKMQKEAVKNFLLVLQLVINEYKVGTQAFSDVVVAQLNAYTAKKNAISIMGRQMTATVNLIKALGGGWHKDQSN